MEPLFTTQTVLELDDYKSYVKRMTGKRTKNLVIGIVVSVWVLICSVINIRDGNVGIGVFMIAVVILCPVGIRLVYVRQLAKNFDRIRELGGADFGVHFYEDHLETKTKDGGGSYLYDRMYRIVETEKEYYIELEAGQCVIVQKKNCSPELAAFIEDLAGRFARNPSEKHPVRAGEE